MPSTPSNSQHWIFFIRVVSVYLFGRGGLHAVQERVELPYFFILINRGFKMHMASNYRLDLARHPRAEPEEIVIFPPELRSPRFRRKVIAAFLACGVSLTLLVSVVVYMRGFPSSRSMLGQQDSVDWKSWGKEQDPRGEMWYRRFMHRSVDLKSSTPFL